MSRIELSRMSLDRSILPPSIYAGMPYLVTEWGVRLSEEARQELKRFLEMYLASAGISAIGTFFRIDAYVDLENDTLSILEVNAHFVDGWGIGLNLARATGNPVKIETNLFPERWTTHEQVYLPELSLACAELRLSGVTDVSPVPWSSCLAGKDFRPVYWYGRFSRYEEFPYIGPAQGSVLDDKIWITKLSYEWASSMIQLPIGYHQDWATWEDLPEDVVLKWRRKYEHDRPVLFRDELKNGKGSRRAYAAGEMIGQEFICPHLLNKRPIQLIILANGTEPLTGYLQHALSPSVRILNDRSEHGPLLFV